MLYIFIHSSQEHSASIWRGYIQGLLDLNLRTIPLNHCSPLKEKKNQNILTGFKAQH